ncbi:MAG TPA: hypothetical protein VM900_04275 [Sphingomonas sp.]|nr:hypothetical protein [Sphingomonas sp.]
MSHDQKPARVRVVRNAANPPLRRRNDPPLASIVIDADAVAQTAAPAPDIPATSVTGARRDMLVGVALFLIGSVGAAVAVTMLVRP